MLTISDPPAPLFWIAINAGSIAGDYDLALTFRVLPAWHEAMTGKAHALRKLDAAGREIKDASSKSKQ